MSYATNCLARLEAALKAGERVPDDASEWALNGFSSFRAGNHETLCEALELRGVGIRKLKNQEAITRRNELLLHAVNEAATDVNQSPYRKCVLFLEQWRRYPSSKRENRWLESLCEMKISIPDTPEGIQMAISKRNGIHR